MVKEESTEQKILDAARTIFMRKGLNGARMQEIADEAGINKALLHYYFRSKDKLFYAIFKEAFNILIPYVSAVFNSDESIEIKLTRLAEKYIDILEINRLPANICPGGNPAESGNYRSSSISTNSLIFRN